MSLLISLVLLSWGFRSNAQTSNVTQCIADYSWSLNSLHQTPCLVAAYLESACSTLSFQVNSIPEGTHYTGPSFEDANPCICSSVTYSLVSACGGCQGRNFTDWNTWINNCPSVTFTTFPKPISDGTGVPPWAYLNLTVTNNTFDPIAAKENATTAQTTSDVISSSTGTIISASGSAISSASETTQVSNSRHSNAGAIAGGVVGGLAFIAALAVLILWLLIRRRNSRASYPHGLAVDITGSSAPPLMKEAPSTRDGPSPLTTSTTPHIYDSPDSNPYPLSPATSGFYTTRPTSRPSMETISNSHFGSQGPRGYTGAAEI
ncbi:hypothetical protein BDQ17DRAFT_1341829 [Cyathus striatus]|nr:hypothetical protein BDQ17DRAFT_1341829 [Cyathus striatus]